MKDLLSLKEILWNRRKKKTSKRPIERKIENELGLSKAKLSYNCAKLIRSFGCVNNDMFLVRRMLGLLELKLNTAQQSSLNLLKVWLHIVDLNGFIFAKELTSKILSWVGVGWIK